MIADFGVNNSIQRLTINSLAISLLFCWCEHTLISFLDHEISGIVFLQFPLSDRISTNITNYLNFCLDGRIKPHDEIDSRFLVRRKLTRTSLFAFLVLHWDKRCPSLRESGWMYLCHIRRMWHLKKSCFPTVTTIVFFKGFSMFFFINQSLKKLKRPVVSFAIIVLNLHSRKKRSSVKGHFCQTTLKVLFTLSIWEPGTISNLTLNPCSHIAKLNTIFYSEITTEFFSYWRIKFRYKLILCPI